MSSDLLTTFLWLGSSGFISGLISWLLANWQWFDDLGDTNPELQQLIKLILSVGMSLLSWALVTYVPADTIQRFNPAWAAIAAGINAISMQAVQGLHVRYTAWLLSREIRIADDRLLLQAKRRELKAKATPPMLRPVLPGVTN